MGNCYKCWDQVGRVETCCFNITSPDKKNYSNIVKFMSWDPFRDEKCGQCVFLPVCFGGCKFHRLNTGKYDCGFTVILKTNSSVIKNFEGGELNEGYPESKDYTKDFHTPC